MSNEPDLPALTEEQIRRGFNYFELHRILGSQRLLNCSMQQFIAACMEAELSWDLLQDADQHIRDEMVVEAELFLGRHTIFNYQGVRAELERRKQSRPPEAAS